MKNQSAKSPKKAKSIHSRHPILKRIRAQPRNRIKELLRSFVTFDLPSDIKERSRKSD